MIRIICRQKGLLLPDFTPVGINYPDSLLNPDYDLYELLNLFQTQSGRTGFLILFFLRIGILPNYLSGFLPSAIVSSGTSMLIIHGNLCLGSMISGFTGEQDIQTQYKELSETPLSEIRQEFLDHDVIILMVAEINLNDLMDFPKMPPPGWR